MRIPRTSPEAAEQALGLAKTDPSRLRRALLLGGAIALVIAIAGVVAVTLHLRSNDNPPPGVASANQALLEKGGPVRRSCCNGPVRLLPGRVTTDALGMKASFQVFDHWYGEQEKGRLDLGKSLSTGGYEVDVSYGGIEVNALDSPLARTARKLVTLPGILMHDVSPVRLGRHSGRRYSFYLNHSLLTFGRCCVFGRREHDVILLGVGHRTLVIEKMPAWGGPDADREAEQVIQSFRVHS